MFKFTFEIEDLRYALDLHTIVAVTDLQGRITMVNDNFCKISKYSREELVGQDHRLVNSGYHSKDFMKNLWSTIEHGKIWQGKLRNRAKDGGIYWVNTTIMPLLDENHRPKSYLAVRNDITDQMNSGMDHEFILKCLDVGVWIYDLSTKEIRWDDTMFRLLGVERSQYATANEAWHASVSSEIKVKVTEALKLAISGASEFNINFQVVHRSGKIQELRNRAFVLRGKDGSPLAVHGISIDQNREVALQLAMERERAKTLHSSKLASIGEMAAGVAHEINNPLAIIVGMAGSLRKNKGDPEKFEAKLRSLEKSAERIRKLVIGLKKFSHSSEGEKFEYCSLKKIIVDLLGFMEVKSKQCDTPVAVEMFSESFLYCDELAIGQVFVNLIGNAIDAVKDSVNRWVKVEVEEDNECITCRVIDSGLGIPEQVRTKMFEPFFTTKPVGEGTGLGLSIIKGILDKHGATIEVPENYPNTCFEIKFAKAKFPLANA